MTTSPSRQPKGIPVGGQFAATAHPEPDLNLAQGKAQLTVAPGVDAALARKLTAGGLKGTIATYEGNNPDAGQNPHTYTSPAGRELIISSSGNDGFRVMYDDRYDEDTFSLETDSDAEPAECVDTVQDALWQLAVNDANAEMDGGLHDGDYYELRELTLDRTPEGGLIGEIRARNDDDSETVIHHDLQAGTTTVYRDDDFGGNARLDGLAADWELAAVFEGLHSEPEDGDFYRHTASFFGKLKARAAEDPDSPAWAKTPGQ